MENGKVTSKRASPRWDTAKIREAVSSVDGIRKQESEMT